MSKRPHGLATRTLRGMAWAYGAYVGGRVLVLLSTAILARLLTPAEFGVVALALTFMTFLDAIKDLGLAQALIVASPEEEEVRSHTVFVWSILIGAALSAITAAVSPLAASFFHQPGLTALLAVLGLNFFVRSLGATHYALARKQLSYRVRTVSEITEVTVRGVVSIALAATGAGAWSLVLGFVAGVAAGTVALWLLVDFRPRLRMTRAYLRDLLSFGGILTVVDIGAVLAYNLDYLFVGRILGAASLGLYSIGFRMPELLIMNIANVAGEVLFPAYSALDRSKLREGFLVGLRYTTMITVPIATGVVVLARPIVLVVFGHQWVDSIPVMQVITGYALCVTLGIPSGTVFKVTRQAWIMVAFTVPYLFVLAALLALFTHHGILTVAICTTALQASGLPLAFWVACRRLRVRVRDALRVVVAPVVASAAMAAAVAPLAAAIDTPLPALIAGVVVGVLVYAAVLLTIARDALLALRGMAFPSLAADR